VKCDIFLKLIQPRVKNLKYSNRKFVNTKGDPFNIVGVVTVDISLENFVDTFRIELFVLKEFLVSYDIILGRDFIGKEKFIITCDKKSADLDHVENDVNLFKALPLHVEDGGLRLEKVLDDIVIDYDPAVRDYLTRFVRESSRFYSFFSR